MSTENPYLAEATGGFANPITWSGTNKAKVAQLIDLVSRESSSSPRGRLDGMFPSTRDHLVMILNSLEESIVNV